MSENYFYSSLSGQEIEDTLVGAVRFNAGQTLTSAQKEQARQNIGAGSESSSFKILGFFDTLQDLEDWLQVLPSSGDAYGIGVAEPYGIYVWDGVNSEWVNNGTISTGLYIDDNNTSINSTWSSSKIESELSDKQDAITASGVLKGNGSAVSAATKGTDYGALSFTITLAAASWSANSQTVNNVNILASGYSYIVAPASVSFIAYAESQIYANDVSVDGAIVFHCVNVPSSDLSVNICRVVSA